MTETRTTLREHESELVVASATAAADGVRELRLVDESGTGLPPWTPGAHVDLVLGDDLVRQYSLCGDPTDPSSFTVAVLREPESRGGSSYVHEQLTEGSRVRVVRLQDDRLARVVLRLGLLVLRDPCRRCDDLDRAVAIAFELRGRQDLLERDVPRHLAHR